MAKMFEDALCELGVIKDDSPKYVKTSVISVYSMPRGTKNSKDKDLLEILIEPTC